MDQLTTLFITVLLGICGFLLARIVYKVEKIDSNVNKLAGNDIRHGEQIKGLRKDIDSHDKRIADLERTKILPSVSY